MERSSHRDPAFAINPFFAAIMQAAVRVSEEPYAPFAGDCCDNRWVIVATTGSNLILRLDEELCHPDSVQIARKLEVSHSITNDISQLTRPISLMPVGCN